MPFRSALPALIVVLITWSAPALNAQPAFPSIDSVEPAVAAETEELSLLGSTFGSKRPRLFLAQDGQLVKHTKIKVLEHIPPTEEGEPAELRARVIRGKVGVFQLVVQVKGQSKVFTDVELELVPPRILSVAPVPLAVPGSYEIDVEHPGGKRRLVRIAGRKTKILAQTEGDGFTSMIVRPAPLPDGTWDLTFENRLGRDYAHQAISVSDSAVTKFPRPYLAWTAGGLSRFSSRRGLKIGTTAAFQNLRLTGKVRVKGVTLHMGVALPFAAIADLEPPQTYEPAGFPVQPSICFLFPESSCGFGLSHVVTQKELQNIYLSAGPLDQEHTFFLSAVDDEAVAGSYFGAQTRDFGSDELGPELLEFEGSFIAERIEQPFATDP